MDDWAIPTTWAPSTGARRGDGFLATPFSERCAGLLDAGHHVFLGISPGNGYFSEERLVALLRWAAARFTRVEIAHPGPETVACTYLGRGYEPRHARARAHRDVRQTANRISRAVTTARIDPGRLHVARFSAFYDTPAYRTALERVTRAHQEQPAFHATCTRMVTGVLRTTMPTDWTPSADQLTAGTEYLDRELPSLLDTPAILGVPTSVFAYRATPALAGFFYGPNAPLPAVATQGFVTVEPLPAMR
ncbi:tRNA-dependent cyclodipeptide synthase [Streptomyces sp. NPDC102270]|uniref:tRNA-dependent cyclodipeptide synthase n=1 Tax=Streptomyces sp. NPDC102270 TaxID=3366150 RepID=UPI00382B3581